MVRHIVMWKLNDTAKEKGVKAVVEEIDHPGLPAGALPRKAPGLLAAGAGMDRSPPSATTSFSPTLPR